jgi:hypothetical protein
MKWLGRWLARVIQQSHQDDEIRPDRLMASPKLSRGSDVDSDEGLNITVRKAIGGKIVTFRHYDHKTDRSSWKNYVIPDDLEFERELGKMITLESMR